MAAESIIQVLRKDDYTQQTFHTLPASGSLLPLPLSSVRVRTSIIALTNNNISYAIGGTFLHWWDAYPVPLTLPAPYNDSDLYGTVCAWGYAIVLESNNSITPGSLLKGYFPVSTLPTDLLLEPAVAPDHWIETSPHRSKLMSLYQRYVVAAPPLPSDSKLTVQNHNSLAWDVLLGVLWECAYLFNRLIFAPPSIVPVHPSGVPQPWTSAEADLSQATVVLLAASGKTAISVAQQLRHARAPGTGPLAIVGVTSAASVPFLQGTGFYTCVLSYVDLERSNTLSAIISDGTKRVVVLNFGSRGKAVKDLHSRLQKEGSAVKLTMLAVGSEARVYTPEQVAERVAWAQRLSLIQANTSPLRDRAIELMGEEVYFDEMGKAWRMFKENGGIPGMDLNWGNGMLGVDGVEGGWDRLCAGKGAGPEKGLVYKL